MIFVGLILLAEVIPGSTALELQDTVQESGEDSDTGGLLTAVTRAPSLSPREISDVFVRVSHRGMFQLQYEALWETVPVSLRRLIRAGCAI